MRRLVVLIALTVAVVAACGVDLDEASDVGTGATSTTTPGGGTGSSAPPASGEPSSKAEPRLLDAEDLGAAWTKGSTSTLPEIPTCPESTERPEPVDQAQAVLVRGEFSPIVIQIVSVYASDEDAKKAVAAFEADIEDCGNPLLEVEDLSMPAHGDEQKTARLKVGGTGFGLTADLVLVRVGNVTTLVDYLNFSTTDTQDLPDIVDAAVAKL